MTSKPSISEMEAWLKEAMPGNAEWSPSDFARLAYQAGWKSALTKAAVIRKLATVSVEPFRRFQFRDGATFPEMHPKMDLETINLFTIEALAAARVQAIEEAASRVKEFNHPLVNLTIDGRARLATEIRALIT